MNIIDFINNYTEIILVILIIFGYIIIDYYLRRKNKELKKSLYDKYNIIEKDIKNISEIANINEADQLAYYKNKNFISFLRFGLLFALLSFYILHKLPNFFSFFAIAVGAIIITFKEIIQCFIGFFYISTQYKIGDDVIINDGKTELRGEIIYINILNIGLVGRDEIGENNGQFYRVPNYKFFNDIIRREDISLHKYKKEEIILVYNRKDFNISFDDFLEKLTSHLDDLLPKRTIGNVGNFRTFIGYKYKIRFEYEKEFLKIKITFIVRPRNIFELEKSIFAFAENYKKIS